MSITDRIDTAGTQATVIYLGLREWKELRDYAAEACCYLTSPPYSEDHRCEYCGKKIFIVDAEEHLGAA